MPKIAKELTPLQVKRITRSGLHAVGGVAGLLLQVTPTGARSWIYRKVAGDRRRDYGLGGYPDTTLEEARQLAREYRALIRQGIDPADQREAAKRALIEAQERTKAFRECAIAYHGKKHKEFKNPKHKREWLRSLEMYAFPIIGNLPASEINLNHIRKVLEPIWATKTETATRVRQRIEKVLDYAKTLNYREGDNPAAWNGNLEAVLPNPAKIRKVKHFRAIDWREVPAFMAELRKREGISARALEFGILTAARSGDIRGATWDEIDLDNKLWIIPAERMKREKEHRVPLSDDAVKLLKSLPRINELVFPAPRGGMLSDMSLLAVTKRMEVDATPHGFRSSFKDWARNSPKRYPDEVSELALAHVNSDATRAAYARDMLLNPRRVMMQDWAKYLKQVPRGGVVVDMRAKA